MFGYTGRPLDENTGLQNNLNRWYDAVTGQWMSEDPIGFEARDENLRRYVENRPDHAVDPLGLKSFMDPMVFHRIINPPKKAKQSPRLRAGESAPPKFKPGGPNDLPIELKGMWKVSICADDAHAWIRFEKVDTGEVHTTGRYKHGFGGRVDEDGNQVVPPTFISGVQYDHDLIKEEGVKNGKFVTRSVIVKDPKIFKGKNPFGFGGAPYSWVGLGDATNNCSTYARDAWFFYSGEYHYMPGPDHPSRLRMWIDDMNNPPTVDELQGKAFIEAGFTK
jgi:RHS repeat-associated protein